MRSLLLTAVLGAVLSAAPAGAQFAETARPLPVVTDGTFAASAVQIGRRVFLGGGFRSVSAPTGGAVVVDVFGRQIPNAFPRVDGPVSQIVPDGVGGWFLVGDFTSVAGQPVARFSRVTPPTHR